MPDYDILIIDDDDHIIRILKEYFEYENFQVHTAQTGKEGLEKIDLINPDLVVLDIMLPEMDGWEVCQQLRPANKVPIIILSAKTKDSDRITGLELGADDYVTKPFSPKEVVARAKAVLRRLSQTNNDDKEIIKYDNISINKNERSVKVQGEKIELTPKEFNLLWTLASSPKIVFDREKLLKKVWGYDYFGDIRTVDTHIKSLRKKLGDQADEYIETVWGVGYKFETDKED